MTTARTQVRRNARTLERLVRSTLGGTALAIVATGSLVAQKTSAPVNLKDFDAYVAKAMKDWKVPGMAIAIVRNDSIVLAKGYGVRKLGEATPVDPHTIFAIGSASKAFTAAAVAMLVDDGKMKWDVPVTTYLPGFQMYDPYVTRELTVRDVLSHRSGLARGDLVWYASDYSRDEVLRRVRYLKPSWSFRSNFGYQNIMFLAGGQAAAAASGRDYDTLIKERIFTPLGMHESYTSVRPLAALPDVAQPYADLDGVVTWVPYANIDNIAPAGSINSNVLDMAQWVRLQLGGGKINGKQLISSGNLAQMHTPQMVIRNEPPWSIYFPEAHLQAYGMGWFLNDYKGKLAVHHGGNIDGMSSLVAMLPEEKLGVVVLTNMNGSLLPSVMVHRVFDDQLKLPPTDFSGEMRVKADALQKQAREALAKLEASRVPNTKPTLALDKYAGTYSDSMYGDVTVRLQNDKLAISYGGESDGELEHWHYDTFRAVWKNRLLGKSMVTFTIDGTPKVGSMNIENLADFRRVPGKADTTAAVTVALGDMQKFVGKFGAKEVPFTVDVQLIGTALKMSVPGQPSYTLVPVSPTRFRLAGDGVPAGFFVDYTLDGGRVKSVKLEQPAPQPTLVLTPVS
jgi:CubicO group peptidase (beta-lactamase class C family)